MWAWLASVLSLDGTLCKKEQRKRTIFFAINAVNLVFVSCFSISLMQKVFLNKVIQTIFILTALFSVLVVLSKRPLTVTVVVGVCYSYASGVLLLDLLSRCLGETFWAALVLVVDCLIVLEAPARYTVGLVCFTVVWLVVMSAEEYMRVGLFDMPGLVPQEGDLGRRVHFSRMTECQDLPCKINPTEDLLAALQVFVIDFVATRGFAEEVEKEQASMARTIETVEAAAQLLAGYDVDTVAELLEAAEGRLPPAMHAALQRLEENLRLYRPYLPVALFERVSVDDEGRRSFAPVAAPGSESGEATLVFTDIRSSTSVWEAAPEAMQKAINIHNAVMREAVSRFCGYEVKTIGDAFMVAFEGPCAGVCFGLAVQEALLAAEWPAALLEVPICRQTGLWGGLTVRVGVNHGPVMAETNALTGRVDYFGHTVNVASRLESTCVPGAVAVPSAVWSQVSGACAPAVAGGKVVAELKGVSEALPVRHVWPAALADRQHKPLAELPPDVLSLSSLGSISSFSSRLYRSVNRAATVTQGHATVGVLSLTTVMDSSAHHQISDCLELIVPLLQQSRGTLVSLLGERLFTGWNLVQPVRVHAENAVQFVRRVLRVPLCESLTVGLASGTVYHGDVGTRSQRFVTAAGPGVAAGLQVWRTACDAGRRFLYSPGEGTVLVGALQAVLQPTTLVLQKPASWGTLPALYELLDEARGNERHDKVSKVQLD